MHSVQVDKARRAARGAPDTERLQAAVAMVVERLKPDQIILFGSAARNEMSEHSDLDLLVLKEHNDTRSRIHHDHWTCPASGDQLDVIVMDRATAERHRQSASHLQGAALEEGRTLYVRKGITPTRTGPTYAWDGKQMVKTTTFHPDHANELLDKAERKWEDANRTRHPADKCEYLQRAMEHAFKALITAEGRRVQHIHQLEDLWQEAEANGEKVRAIRNPEQLKKLSKYAGKWRYDLPTDENPAKTWADNRPTGEDILNHARSRVPQLIQKTEKVLSTFKRLAESGEPPEQPPRAPGPASDAGNSRDRNKPPRGPER